MSLRSKNSMSKIIKRALLLLLSMMMVFAATAFSVPYEETAEARTIFDIEKELSEYKKELSRLQSELAQISKNIASIENQSGQTAELLTQYWAEIEALEVEITINNAIMESYDAKRAEVITEMAVIEEDYDYRVSMYKKLMQFIYENSSVNSFELLFSAESISDYLTKRDHFNDIMNAANELIKEIEVSISDLEALDAELSETQSKYDTYLTDLNRSKLEREQKITEFETIAKELNLNSEELSAQVTEKNAEIKNIKTKIAALEEERKKMYNDTSVFCWPVQTSSYRVTSQYGWRNDPFGKPTTEFHKGIDIACSRGTPILAVRDGVVTKATDYGGYGECVIVYHGNGISSLYAHIDNSGKNGDLPYKSKANGKPTYCVKEGDSVKKGQVLAYVGTTGRSTGYHLHFGVINTNESHPQGGQYADPNKYLPNGYYEKKTYNN